MVLNIVCCSIVVGDEPQQDASLREMTARASSVHLRTAGESDALHVNATPLFRYNDATFETSDGALWLWESDSRPLALLCLFHKTYRAEEWNYELTLLDGGPINVTGRAGWVWNPERVSREWLALDGPEVHTREAVRLRQLRALAREFAATEPDEDNFQLRLLPQPVHRYSRPQDGILDGALFLFVYDTNPEVVLQLEAVSGDEPGWRAAFGRITGNRLAVSRRGEPVWQAEPVRHWNPKATYYSHYGPDPLQPMESSPPKRSRHECEEVDSMTDTFDNWILFAEPREPLDAD